jgi:hypothetical protein
VLGARLTGGLAPWTQLRIGVVGSALDNVTLDVVGGAQGITSGQSIALAAGTASVELRVHRIDASRAATVPLSLIDRCGPWNTFVGGGPSAF